MVKRGVQRRARKRLKYRLVQMVIPAGLRHRFVPRPPTYSTTRIAERLQALDEEVFRAHAKYLLHQDLAYSLALDAIEYQRVLQRLGWRRSELECDQVWAAFARATTEADIAMTECTRALVQLQWCTRQYYHCPVF